MLRARDILNHLTSGPGLAREAGDHDRRAPAYRMLLAAVCMLALGSMLAAVVLTHPQPYLECWLLLAIVSTEPFLWSLALGDRVSRPAYGVLVLLNLVALLSFFLSTSHGSGVAAVYLLVVIAALDTAVDTSVFVRAVPLAVLLMCFRALPPLSPLVVLSLLSVLVLWELRSGSQRRHQRLSIAGLKEEIARTRDAGHRDELTRLYNRSIIPYRVEALFDACRSEGQAFGIVLFDVDRLKEANDTHGHLFGDEVIRGAARSLLAVKRPEDFAIRYGGDELLLVTTGVESYEELVGIAVRVRGRAAIDAHGGDFPVTLSAGCMLVPDTPADDFQDAFRWADRALYAAKRRGRDRVVRADDARGFGSQAGPERD